jgi:hypothetical protein
MYFEESLMNFFLKINKFYYILHTKYFHHLQNHE